MKTGGLAGELQALEDIAVEQKMNTQVMKIIFASMMTADDYVDAFEKLVHLSLTKAQVRPLV